LRLVGFAQLSIFGKLGLPFKIGLFLPPLKLESG
jgi:hypothetical protein